MTTRPRTPKEDGRKAAKGQARETKPARRVKAQEGKELVLKEKPAAKKDAGKGNGKPTELPEPAEQFCERELADIIPENRRMLVGLHAVDSFEVGEVEAEPPKTAVPGCSQRRRAPTCDDYARSGNRSVEGRRSARLDQGVAGQEEPEQEGNETDD